MRVLQAKAPTEGAKGEFILQELEVKNSFLATDDEEEKAEAPAPAPAADASPSKTRAGRQPKVPNRLSSSAMQ